MQQVQVLPSWKAFVDESLCVGCGKCVKVCWTGAISVVDKKAVVDFYRCICCTACMKICPRGAIRLVPYSFPLVQRDEGLAGIKTRLNALGSELEEIQKSIEAL
jgi:heterodisulfide reductase subunit A-like polyferredoxin